VGKVLYFCKKQIVNIITNVKKIVGLMVSWS